MKTFYGGKFIAKSKLEKEGIFYPIKLEYYKSIETKEDRPSDNYARFGISVVKTEYIPDNIKIVSREVKDISADERKIENLLSILKEMEVTPIALEEIIKDLQPEYSLKYCKRKLGSEYLLSRKE